jgi:uncharacterized protein (TIGR04255 family)
MPWSIEQKPHQVFTRNPLVAVVVDLRYHPILKVTDRVADFQDRVRASFPGFQEATSQLVSVNPFGPIDVRSDKLFQFREENGAATLTLTSGGLTLECLRHEHRRVFLDGMKVGSDALEATYAPISPTRLGLRYINVIDRAQVSKDLGREVLWDALIAPAFRAVPSGLAEFDGAAFACEVSSTMPTGAMTLRYGLLREQPGGELSFRLDIDRYVEGSVVASAISKTLEGFSNDIFSVFVAAMGPDLQEWMPAKEDLHE